MPNRLSDIQVADIGCEVEISNLKYSIRGVLEDFRNHSSQGYVTVKLNGSWHENLPVTDRYQVLDNRNVFALRDIRREHIGHYVRIKDPSTEANGILREFSLRRGSFTNNKTYYDLVSVYLELKDSSRVWVYDIPDTASYRVIESLDEEGTEMGDVFEQHDDRPLTGGMFSTGTSWTGSAVDPYPCDLGFGDGRGCGMHKFVMSSIGQIFCEQCGYRKIPT